MDKVWMALMKKALEVLVSGQAFSMIEELVSELMDADMKGAEKKKIVIEKVAPYVRKAGMFVLSTAITFAVDSIRMKIETEGGV